MAPYGSFQLFTTLLLRILFCKIPLNFVKFQEVTWSADGGKRCMHIDYELGKGTKITNQVELTLLMVQP